MFANPDVDAELSDMNTPRVTGDARAGRNFDKQESGVCVFGCIWYADTDGQTMRFGLA